MSKAKESMLRFRSYREMAELLSYAYLLNEETIMHKDGGLSAHFVYVAQDVDSSTGNVLNANAYAVLQALNLLEDGWMVETNLISEESRKYSKEQHFPDIVSALIDDTRRYRFSQEKTFFQSLCFLSISYVPTAKLGKKISKILVDSEERTQTLDDEYEYFEGVISRFLTHFMKITRPVFNEEQHILGLENLELNNLRRLKSDSLISFLHKCITGKTQQLKAPSVGYFLDAYLSSEHFLAGIQPKVGEKWTKILSIDDLPESVYPAILDVLNYLGFEYRWSSRYIALSTITADKYLKNIRTKWANKAIGVMGIVKMAFNLQPKIDEAAEEKQQAASQAIKENNSGELRYGFMTSVIVLMNEDKEALDNAAEHITKTIEALGYKIRDEKINATEAYLGSIPGHGGYNVRKPIVDSLYASYALPTSSIWQGSEYAPCPFYPKKSPPLLYVRTKGSRSFRLNLHVSDVGHFMIIGPTGSGKSTLLGLISAQFRKYADSRIILFDKDFSNKGSLLSLNGDYFSAYGGTQFAPLAGLAHFQEGSTAFEAEITFLIEWICEICELRKVEITPDKRRKIEDALRALAKTGKENLVLDLLSIQDQEIRDAIDSFNSGAIKKMINGVEDSLTHNSVIGMEMGDLLKLGQEIFIPIVRSIFHRLTQIFEDRRPTLLIIEEAWFFWEHPIFQKIMKDWLLTLRKFNVAVGFCVQSPELINETKIATVIKESCPTRIFLPNIRAMERPIAQSYFDFGLNEEEVKIITSAVSKQDYYVTSPLGSRLIQLELDQVSLSFIGISGKKLSKFDEIYRKDNPSWILDWLQYQIDQASMTHGLTKAKYVVEELSSWRDYVEKYYFNGDEYAQG